MRESLTICETVMNDMENGGIKLNFNQSDFDLLSEKVFTDVFVVSSPDGKINKIMMDIDKNNKNKHKKFRTKNSTVITNQFVQCFWKGVKKHNSQNHTERSVIDCSLNPFPFVFCGITVQ